MHELSLQLFWIPRFWWDQNRSCFSSTLLCAFLAGNTLNIIKLYRLYRYFLTMIGRSYLSMQHLSTDPWAYLRLRRNKRCPLCMRAIDESSSPKGRWADENHHIMESWALRHYKARSPWELQVGVPNRLISRLVEGVCMLQSNVQRFGDCFDPLTQSPTS